MSTLFLLYDNNENGDKHQQIHRDAGGNLYHTTNADSQARLTGREFMAWDFDSVRRAVADMTERCGSELAANFVSQCGGYDYLDANEQDLVDAWNTRFGR